MQQLLILLNIIATPMLKLYITNGATHLYKLYNVVCLMIISRIVIVIGCNINIQVEYLSPIFANTLVKKQDLFSHDKENIKHITAKKVVLM